ncbi:MAG: HAD-IIIA family hydrolase [Polyangiaceae bacterium]|nr:HAD-IIIA family hydrolase [Polyangiaceae bacterium]
MSADASQSRGALAPEEIARRAARVKLVLTDCDGVLTDNGVYYSARGEEMKRFSIRDGMGVERLRNAGIETAIITGENAEMVQRRADKLKIRAHLGVKDKAGRLPELLALHAVALNEIAYIGDDVNDLGAMDEVAPGGLVAAPGDAMPDVARRVHFLTKAPGGHGAFREFAEWILAARS